MPCSSKIVADTTKKYCSIFGIPDVIRSDNGPHFIGEAYKHFVEEWNIKHNTSSPRFPKSNGMAERNVRTIKNIIKKTIRTKGDVQLALLRWRTTPISSKIESPATLMFSRKIQDTLPSYPCKIAKDNEEVKEKLQERYQKSIPSVPTKPLPPVVPGQQVRILSPPGKTWTKGTVLEKDTNPRSYIVQPEAGMTVRRNRAHLRPVDVPLVPQLATSARKPQPGTNAPPKAQPGLSEPPESPPGPHAPTNPQPELSVPPKSPTAVNAPTKSQTGLNAPPKSQTGLNAPPKSSRYGRKYTGPDRFTPE